MSRHQLILTGLAIILVVGLYQLPRVVVNNEKETIDAPHSLEVSDFDSDAIASLNERLSDNQLEFSVNFADSLARLYLKYGFLDSATNVMSSVLTRDSSLNTLKKAGWIFYSVFERSQTPAELQRKAAITGEVLNEVVRLDPADLSAKSKLAMTLVSTENPMAGITMLREVLSVDPDFREAIINMGILSMQSGQLDRAVERFERLLELDENDQESRLYLGVCYMENGQSDLAEEMFTIVAGDQMADPALMAAAQEYLNELRN